MNIWDIVIILIVALAVGAAVRRMIINRKNGRSSCGCGCQNCSGNCAVKMNGKKGNEE